MCQRSTPAGAARCCSDHQRSHLCTPSTLNARRCCCPLLRASSKRSHLCTRVNSTLHPCGCCSLLRALSAASTLRPLHTTRQCSSLIAAARPLGSINQVLDTVSACTDLKSVGEVYRLTLGALKSGGNERLWFNTKAKLAKAYLQGGDFAAADHTIAELHRTCTGADGADDQSKGTYLLEVYGLIIQLCTATKDTARMREVYPKVMQLNAAVEDPRTMGLIREEGGKMYMATGQWSMAYNEFYEGFRNYQEAGNKRAKDCLKYVVLANMLALSDINPFAAREAKVYQEEKEVAAMMELRMAYETNDLARFEKTLQNKANRILDDNFIMAYVEPLKRRMREQVLLAIVKPYRRINLAFMARELNLPEPAVEGLLVELILDERLSGSIDQLQGFLQVGEDDADNSPKKYEALMGWSDELRKATTALTSRIALTADARG
eukprot:TRINITY_DN3740_c0_g1_i1.p1 TRINITY_DN3740_c0_g1~~TRINITY_DN3740_c0_g1_i1.p1  ORF type:complete len:436 (-),score=200.11 TRINITY_DN3740_c0_g1_i1:653-1960(-)